MKAEHEKSERLLLNILSKLVADMQKRDSENFAERHAEAIAGMALEMRDFVKGFNIRLRQPLGIRIGVATGPVVAGVIGKSKFAYDLWGDTVNIASRMESHGETGMIQINRETAHFLEGKFEIKKRGTIEIKGKGKMETFFLLGKGP